MSLAYKTQQALSALLAARARLLDDDPDIFADERSLADNLSSETEDVMLLISETIRASIEAASLADAAKERAQSLKERADRFARRAQSYRAAAFAAMDVLGERRITQPDFTATISAGRPAVIVTDEAAIPAELTKTTVTPDKTLIRAALEGGWDVPGAELNNGLPTLSVRTR